MKGAGQALQQSSRGVSWQRNLWSTVVAELLTILGFTAGSVLVPYYVQKMGITGVREVGAWTGAYQSVGSVAFAVSTPIWGALGDRYGCKMMLVRAMGSAAVVLILMGLARNPLQLMVLRVIQGVFTGTPAAASALVATSTPRDRLAYGLGLIQTSQLVGSSLGPMLGGYVGDAFGFRTTFYVSSIVVFAATLVIVALVQEPLGVSSATMQAGRRNPVAAFRDLLGSSRLVLLIGMILVINLTYGLLGPVVPLFVQQLVVNKDRVASTAGAISGVAAFTGAVSALVVGRFSDRIGHRRALLGCLGGMSLLYVPQALARSATMLGSALGTQGLFQGGISPNTSAMVVGFASKEKTGAALGLSSSASSVGYALGPVLGALVLAVATPRVAYIAAASIFGVLTLAVALGPRASRRQV